MFGTSVHARNASHMRRALVEAHKSAERGDLGVGAVVVLSNQVVACGGNEASSTQNPLAHAEMQALAEFTRRNPSQLLTQATLYTTFEPCPMCLGACLVAGLETIVVGGTRSAQDHQWGGYQPAAFADLIRASGPQIQILQGPYSVECISIRSLSNDKETSMTCTTESRGRV